FQQLIEKDTSYNVVNIAAKAVGEIGTPAAFDILTTLLKQDSWQDIMAQSALDALATMSDARVLEIMLNYAKTGHSVILRASAINALGILGRGNSQAIAIISDALNEKAASLNYVAVRALGAIGDEQATAILEKLLQQENNDDALISLAQ